MNTYHTYALILRCEPLIGDVTEQYCDKIAQRIRGKALKPFRAM